MIILVSVPFLGHYTAIKRIAEKLIQMDEEFLIILLSWKDFPIPVESSRMLSGNQIILETKKCLTETDPTEFNWNRAKELTPRLVERIEALPWPPTCIIYDFFCVEAYIAAKTLRLKSICCIPAIPFQFCATGDFPTEDWHLQNCSSACVSDFQMINDPKESKWLTCPPAMQVDTTYLDPICCVDVIEHTCLLNMPNGGICDIFVCFGTVVTGNLFNNATPQFRDALLSLYEKICIFANANKYFAYISIPGKQAYDFVTGKLYQKYREFVHFTEFCDQIEFLRDCKLFITHGGGNSVAEAIRENNAMLCIPFFGDQWASAHYVAKNGFGLAFTLETPRLVTTQDCLNDLVTFEKKISFLADNMAKVYENRRTFSTAVIAAKQKYKATSFHNALYGEIDKPVAMQWQDGDLLFGTSLDRQNFCKFATGVVHDFHFGTHFNSNRWQQFPTLIDHYHDICYGSAPTLFDETLAAQYKDAQPKELQGKQIATMTRQEVAMACCAGIDFFFKQFPHNVIHFVVGDDFMNNKDSVAHAELAHIRQSDEWHRVIFYRFKNFVLHRVNIEQVSWFNWEPIDSQLATCTRVLPFLADWFNEKVLKEAIPICGGATMEYRVKSRSSLMANFDKNRFISSDIIGFRIVHPFTASLFVISDLVEKKCKLLHKRVSERGKVIHMLLKVQSCVVELQLWPSVLHNAFVAEHDTVYKAVGRLSDLESEKSKELREKEHKIQDMLDRVGPLIQN